MKFLLSYKNMEDTILNTVKKKFKFMWSLNTNLQRKKIYLLLLLILERTTN